MTNKIVAVRQIPDEVSIACSGSRISPYCEDEATHSIIFADGCIRPQCESCKEDDIQTDSSCTNKFCWHCGDIFDTDNDTNLCGKCDDSLSMQCPEHDWNYKE